MVRLLIDLPDTTSVAALVDILLTAADHTEPRRPEDAQLWRGVADGIGDGLDSLGSR
jgi:hypothetical protein